MLTRFAAALLALLVSLPALAQQQQQRPAQQPAPQFTLKNDGEVQLRELYIVRSGQAQRGQGQRDWGPDRLGADVVPAGQSFRVRLPAGFGCVVDLRIVFESGEDEVRDRVDVCRAREVSFARAAAATQAQEREVAIENGSPRAIQQLFVSGADEREWGEDRLGSDTVPPGASYTARVPDRGCSYDVRAVFDNGGAEERRRIDLCAVSPLVITPGWTTAEDLTAGRQAAPVTDEVTIVNRSGRIVFEVYVFADGAGNRGPDRLGADTLADGATLRVPGASPPGCWTTLALTYDNGVREERAGIDFCTTREVVIAPGWTGVDPARQGPTAGAPSPGGASAPAAPPPTAAPPVASPPASSPGTIGVVNRSGRVVFELYSFPDGAANEGPDRLGSDTMRDGGSIRVPSARAPGCATTVRVVYETGEREERTGLDFCRLGELVIGPGWTSAATAGAARLVNAGTAPIVALHADRPGTPRGPDRLGDAVLGVGQGFTLAAPESGVCAYDITAVFRDRRTARIAGADLCAGTEIRIAP